MPKANFDLPKETLDEVVKLSQAKSKREAIVIALESYIRKKKLESLIESAGKVSLDWTKESLKKYRQ